MGRGRGKCKLTGREGAYVKSHLLPKALTRRDEGGDYFVQGGSGELAIRRWDSWYDKRLVTAEGEALLADLDGWAITYLRRRKLVWSGWGPMKNLGALHYGIPGTPWGVRKVYVDDPCKLRLFFSSILWRAAASDLSEFSDVNISYSDLERLRVMIVSGELEDISFYPTTLIQISTLGLIHNHSPILQSKTIVSLKKMKIKKSQYSDFIWMD